LNYEAAQRPFVHRKDAKHEFHRRLISLSADQTTLELWRGKDAGKAKTTALRAWRLGLISMILLH
jgi:hypothetical protein